MIHSHEMLRLRPLIDPPASEAPDADCTGARTAAAGAREAPAAGIGFEALLRDARDALMQDLHQAACESGSPPRPASSPGGGLRAFCGALEQLQAGALPRIADDLHALARERGADAPDRSTSAWATLREQVELRLRVAEQSQHALQHVGCRSLRTQGQWTLAFATGAVDVLATRVSPGVLAGVDPALLARLVSLATYPVMATAAQVLAQGQDTRALAAGVAPAGPAAADQAALQALRAYAQADPPELSDRDLAFLVDRHAEALRLAPTRSEPDLRALHVDLQGLFSARTDRLCRDAGPPAASAPATEPAAPGPTAAPHHGPARPAAGSDVAGSLARGAGAAVHVAAAGWPGAPADRASPGPSGGGPTPAGAGPGASPIIRGRAGHHPGSGGDDLQPLLDRINRHPMRAPAHPPAPSFIEQMICLRRPQRPQQAPLLPLLLEDIRRHDLPVPPLGFRLAFLDAEDVRRHGLPAPGLRDPEFDQRLLAIIHHTARSRGSAGQVPSLTGNPRVMHRFTDPTKEQTRIQVSTQHDPEGFMTTAHILLNHSARLHRQYPRQLSAATVAKALELLLGESEFEMFYVNGDIPKDWIVSAEPMRAPAPERRAPTRGAGRGP